jgi:hydrogenase nickel incorporation protein HypB
MAKVELKQNVKSKNQEFADANRQNFARSATYVMNLTSSPGSGKTSLMEKTLPALTRNYRIFVIEGDVETDADSRRIHKLGIAATQIETHNACHLDASMITSIISQLKLNEIDLLVIENIGNLICPVGFDLGEDLRVVVASTAEGEDKPLKYPAAYHRATVAILNKIDLLPHLSFDTARFEMAARQANPELRIFPTSCVTNEGIGDWCAWLSDQIKQKKQTSAG